MGAGLVVVDAEGRGAEWLCESARSRAGVAVPLRVSSSVCQRDCAPARPFGAVRSAGQLVPAARDRTLSAASNSWPTPAKTARSITAGASLMRSLTCGMGMVISPWVAWAAAVLVGPPGRPMPMYLSSFSLPAPFTAAGPGRLRKLAARTAHSSFWITTHLPREARLSRPNLCPAGYRRAPLAPGPPIAVAAPGQSVFMLGTVEE